MSQKDEDNIDLKPPEVEPVPVDPDRTAKQQKKEETLTIKKAIETEQAWDRLSEKEKRAYSYFKESGQEEVGYVTHAQMFNLYISGKNTYEIKELNPDYNLGQVVAAKITGEWDKRRDSYVNDLLDNVQARAYQASIESVHFVSDVIMAAHRLNGPNVKRYLQTGKEKDLKGFKVDNIHQYSKLLETLQKMVDKPQIRRHEIILTNKRATEIIDQKPKITLNETNSEEILKKLLEGEK